MCGISGIINFNDSPVTINELKLMSDAIMHRGPDGEGQWLNSASKVGLAHRRLSIIDLSEQANQPMHYANGRYTIAFNGEIYNYIELKKELVAKGYEFKTQSDTEVLMALYDLKKEHCLSDLDGMFAFAIWDEKEQQLFCARDRFGEKPFYYHNSNNRFYFASEMKALFAAGVQKKLSDKRLYYYLSYNTVEDPFDNSSTFFNNIFQLEPSHYLVIKSGGNIIKKKYWDINVSEDKSITFDAAVTKFYSLFETSIKRRLRSDVPVGSSLSGGLDSSSIVLLIDSLKEKGQTQKTFSARFKNFAKDEGEHMQAVIDKAKHVEAFYTWPTEDVLINEIDKIMFHQEEPFGGASILAQWEVMKLAKQNNVTVLIDGQGADEILAGYKPLYISYLNQLFPTNRKLYRQEAQKFEEFNGMKHSLSFTTKMMMMHPSTFKNVSQLYKSISGKKTTTNVPVPFVGEYNKEFLNEVLSFKPPVFIENNDNLKRSQLNIIQKKGFQSLLRFADRNSMAFQRELRLPFLSHELVEFAFTLPDEFKIHQGWTKYIQREAMKGILPESITWRKDKIGYEPPEKNWLENTKVKEIVAESKNKLADEKITGSDSNKFSDWKNIMVAKMLNQK
jgi:asparagine synthase (glutamine-hydrolysing)